MRELVRKYLGIAILVVAAVVVLVGGDPVLIVQLTLVGIFAIAASGQQLLLGKSGQASVGAAAFMGIGAFSVALLGTALPVPFPVALIVGGAAGGIVGLVIGLTSVRLRGIYLMLSTLALHYIVSYVLQLLEGSNGGLVVAAPSIGSFVIVPGAGMAVLVLIVLVVVVLVQRNLYATTPGLAWNAIHQSEEAAAVAGVDVTRWKLTAFVVSSSITSVAGGLYAYQLQFVSHPTFSFELAISILVMVYLGGQRTISGAILGATVVTLFLYALQQVQGTITDPGISTWLSTNAPMVNNVIYGAALVLVLLFERNGLAGLLARLRDHVLPASSSVGVSAVEEFHVDA